MGLRPAAGNHAIAQREGCLKLKLDTALSNALAQRFYFREGLLTGTMRFSKVLPREETGISCASIEPSR